MGQLNWLWLLAQVPPEPVSTPPALPPVDPDVTQIVQQAGLFAGALAGIVTGLVEVAKKCCIPARFAPATAILIGLGLSLSWEASTATHPPMDWWLAVVEGILAGLMSGGLYSLARSVLNPRAFEPDAPRRRDDNERVDYTNIRKQG